MARAEIVLKSLLYLAAGIIAGFVIALFAGSIVSKSTAETIAYIVILVVWINGTYLTYDRVKDE